MENNVDKRDYMNPRKIEELPESKEGIAITIYETAMHYIIPNPNRVELIKQAEIFFNGGHYPNKRCRVISVKDFEDPNNWLYQN
jgi:hypothetical protein